MTKRVTGLESFVAERVSVARELRGFNKRELAKRLGLAESSYNPYELKRIPFTLAMLERLVPILEMPLEWFLGVGELSDGESQRLGDRAHVQPVQAHTFRRTFALTCLRSGMNIYVLQRLMGHKGLSQLQRYLSLVDIDLAQSVREHDPVDRLL